MKVYPIVNSALDLSFTVNFDKAFISLVYNHFIPQSTVILTEQVCFSLY